MCDSQTSPPAPPGAHRSPSRHGEVKNLQGRNPGLDLLRFIAVLLVIGRHMDVCPAQISQVGHEVTQVWQRGGWIGVDLFFVLSGFLISGLLFGEHQRYASIRIGRFLIRRGFKIYPAFWVLLVTTIIVRLIVSREIPLRALIGEITFTQNYLGGLWGHTWSLAVEEHFYIGLSLLLLLLARWKSRGSLPFAEFPIIFLVIALGCLTFRAFGAAYLPFSDTARLFGTHIRIDSLMFGVLLSWYCHYAALEQRLARIPTWLFITAGGLLFAPAFFFRLETTWWIPVFGFVMLYLGSGLLLLAAIRLKTVRLSFIRLLAVLGAYSYSVYLWHIPLNPFVLRLFFKRIGPAHYEIHGIFHYLLYCGLYIAGSFALGYVLAKTVEYPALRMRDRFFPSRSRAIGSG